MANSVDLDQMPQNAVITVNAFSLDTHLQNFFSFILFVYVEVLRPCQPNGVMSSAASLPNHTFTGQA